jgi:hypothetical protein
MIRLKRLILFILLTIPHSGFSQTDTASISIITHSFHVNITSSQNFISTINTFDKGETKLLVSYILGQDRVLSTNASLFKLSGGEWVANDNKIEIPDVSNIKNYSFGWEDNRIRLNFTSDSGLIKTITNVDHDRNTIRLKYYFKNQNLEMVTSKDESRRFLDTLEKYDNKLVSFITAINNPPVAGKKGFGEYWINGYMVRIGDKRLKKIQGKKVKITGTVIYHPGTTGPQRERLFDRTGRELLAGGFPFARNIISEPKIEILKD